MRSCFHFALRATIIAIVFCLICPISFAQSGRRPPKKSDPPAPVQPPSQPEPEAKPSKPEAPRTPILLAKNVWGTGDEITYSSTMLEACAAKLAKSGRLEIDVSREDRNRKEASDYAKNSSKIYVVWMELHFTSRYNRSNTRQGDYDSFYIDYNLYEPVTGKSKTGGRVYQQPYRQGGVGPLPVPGAYVPIEYSIRQAGEDVADRILSALNISLPQNRF
ncbi:MAG: hypothetical protein AB1631_19300 [Acidobacteriota bacterium]